MELHFWELCFGLELSIQLLHNACTYLRCPKYPLAMSTIGEVSLSWNSLMTLYFVEVIIVIGTFHIWDKAAAMIGSPQRIPLKILIQYD